MAVDYGSAEYCRQVAEQDGNVCGNRTGGELVENLWEFCTTRTVCQSDESDNSNGNLGWLSINGQPLSRLLSTVDACRGLDLHTFVDGIGFTGGCELSEKWRRLCSRLRARFTLMKSPDDPE